MAEPEKRFSTRGIVLTVWNNKGTTREGQETSYKTVKCERRYKDKNDNWQSTGSLRVHDVPKAALLLQKAYEYLVVKSEGQ